MEVGHVKQSQYPIVYREEIPNRPIKVYRLVAATPHKLSGLNRWQSHLLELNG